MNGHPAELAFRDPDRNLGMELVRATEAAGIRAVPFIGKGNKNAADAAAVDACAYSSAQERQSTTSEFLVAAGASSPLRTLP